MPPGLCKCEECGKYLAARNIQRGRDHGIPSYSHLRAHCDLKPLTDWDDRPTEIETADWLTLQKVYFHVGDIDGYTGGLSEKAVPGGVVGPTFACYIGKQFKLLMNGDRWVILSK